MASLLTGIALMVGLFAGMGDPGIRAWLGQHPWLAVLGGGLLFGLGSVGYRRTKSLFWHFAGVSGWGLGVWVGIENGGGILAFLAVPGVAALV